MSYDIAGNVTQTSTNGVTTNVTTGSTTNYAAPTQVTTNSLGSGMTWSSSSDSAQPPGPTATPAPSSTTQPAAQHRDLALRGGDLLHLQRHASPPNKSASTDGHWVYTQMDGFGRTILTTTGYSTTTFQRWIRNTRPAAARRSAS